MEDMSEYASMKQIVASLERERVLTALEANRWNATAAARDIGITFRSMRYKMQMLGVKPDREIVREGLGKAWPKLRYAALKLHGNRCQCCGSNPRSGSTMHVDHIKPRHKYPDLAMDINNLQILCSRCHNSKGANDETDWR